MITHVLDTSAVLAHYLREPGAEDVHAIISQQDTVGLCVISLPELKTRLLEILQDDPEEAEHVFKLYADNLTIALPITREIADLSILLRETTRPRLPTVDAVIAACAQKYDAVLVHRDPHLGAIASSAVKQLRLAGKTRLSD